MIFVTVGHDPHSFGRLLKRVEGVQGLLPRGEMFVVQYGYSEFDSKGNTVAAPFFSRDEFSGYLRDADKIVTHAGAGTLLQIAQTGRRSIVVARRKSFREHVNDHQMDIARAFSDRGLCYLINDVSELDMLLLGPIDMALESYTSESGNSLRDSIRRDALRICDAGGVN